jgi:chromosome segregation ATPase
MSNRILIVLLILISLGLGIALITVKKQASAHYREAADSIGNLSNKWVATAEQVSDRDKVIAVLERDLDTQKKAFGELTNSFTQISANLIKTEESLKVSQVEVQKLSTKIADLESQNQALDQRAADLSTSITNLNVQIDDTQRKLTASEGDKAFLQKELARLMAEKAELERQFNDLTVLRAQVAKLKEELSVARRLEWIRQGLFASAEQKGAQKLMQGINPVTKPAKPTPTYDLNVEITSEGKVRVIPPLTNAPATNAPPK